MNNYNVTTYRKETERDRTIDPNSVNENDSGNNKRKSKNKCLIAFIVFAVIVIIFIIGLIIYTFVGKKNNGNGNDQPNIPSDNQNPQKENINNNDNTGDTGNTGNNGINALSKKEALEAFKPNFKILTKTNNLNQVLMKSNIKHSSISNGVESTTLSAFTKAKLDLYTLNESLAIEDSKDFYSSKYYTVITINSMCTTFSASKSDCDLQQYLDLTIKNKNLRTIDEEDLELIKEAILPICVIEHTDTNIIISVTCPETLSYNLKEDIISSFQSIKPETIQGIVSDNSVAGTSITEKDNRKYIDSFNKACDDYDGDPSKNEVCETKKNIVTDLDGNLISMKKSTKKEIIKDEHHKNIRTKVYYIEDVSNSQNFDSNNYKKNLENVFEVIKPYMKKEDYAISNSFNEILENLMKGESNSTKELRGLAAEKREDNIGIFEDQIFSQEINGIDIGINLKNDIGLDYGSNSKIISDLTTGKGSNELSHSESNTKLNETMDKFISLSKSANLIASSLHEELNEPLLEIRNNIDSNINDLNNLLSFKDLSAIFDSTLSISELSTIPYTIVASSENLYSSLNKINNEILYSINDYKNNLKEAISSFLAESHQLLYYIFSNLTETSRLLSSKKSKIAEISSYYLNDTDTSFVDMIQKAKEIMSNYYINEKKLIKPLVDKMLNEFYNDSIISAEKLHTALDILVESLESGKLNINLGNTQDVKNLIYNIYNSKMKVKEILSNIVNKFNNSLGYQDSGYFESQKDLDSNNKSYSEVSNNAIQIANSLDNNLLIDNTFDKIMVYFRDQFVVLLNYMEISKREKFPLKENVLGSSIFTKENIDKIDEGFENDRENISQFVKNENKEYLDFVEKSLDNYKKENLPNLEKYISNIQVELSDNNLDNLNAKYNEMLTSTKNQIDQIIKYNNDLAVEYLTKVINAGSVHCTQGFKNKYNIYINNLNSIRNYIQLNLKNNLVNKYKNIINQIRSYLQKIKSNSIIEKYKNHLSFCDANLRIIDELFVKFDKYISDSLFNKNYLPIINNYISNTIQNLDNLEKNLINLYSQIKKLPDSNLNNDYTIYKKNCWTCCILPFFWICFWHATCCSISYPGYNIKETNNHLNLKTIDLSKYTIDFDNYYSSLDSGVSGSISNYCESINKLSTLFDSQKNELLSKNISYLSDFSNNVESILNNYLGSNLLTSSYNYYKNELEQKIPNELDDFLSKWNEVYDKVDEDLNNNLNNFKSNILEFGLLGSFYYEIYKTNISYGYVDSIVQERKNDLNYTLKYYYNMISFKVNKTYSYIMNNIPINDKPFDEILNTRILQIKNVYNDIIRKIQESKNQILSMKAQLTSLKVSETNFFVINNYVNDNVGKIEEEIPFRYAKLYDTSTLVDIDDTEENVIAKFFIENAQNGKQIKEINEPINKATFTDLQTGVYQKLIEETFQIEKEELIRNIKNSLKESNEKLVKSYKYEKDKYSSIIQNKIYKEFYTKENLEKKITDLYNNGLKDLDAQSNNTIYEYLDQVLNNIKGQANKEAARLNDQLTSYSNNYKVIEATLNEYKEKIYNAFYSAIVSVVEDFYNQIKDTVYTNYIKNNLAALTEATKKENFQKFQFLNITINLKETVIETVELLVNEYQNLSMSQIEYLYNKNIQNLQLLFSFSSIKDKINNEISNIYNSILLPVLKVYAKYNPGDEGISDYDFSTEISNNIDSILNTNIQKTKEIINTMKGDKYIIEEDWKVPDFTLLKREEFKQIQDNFNSFTNAHSNQEIQQIKEVIFENLKSNFNLFIDNFIPSFGIDYFDMILKYNEIQKIKSLYNNLKYSLSQTLIYYIGLCNIHILTMFPDDLKYKILSLNGLESTIRSNNNKILSSLNSKFEEFIKNTKNYLVEKYISEIKIDPYIKESINSSKIILYIEQILDGKRYIFENEYINKMNHYIKDPFIQEYTKTLNKETDKMLNYIEDNKNLAKTDINEIFTLDPDNVLSEIENKLNNTLRAVEAYNLHFNSFNIPDNVKKFLELYIQNTISPRYVEINNILSAATKDLIINNLETNSENFKNSLNSEEFESKNKEINSNLTNSFNKINESLNSYGTIESKYLENLEKNISQYNRIRNLDELDEDKLAYNRRIADVKLDETFQEIENSSLNLKKFIQSLNLFKEFEEKINKYINDINYQYGISQNNIKKFQNYYDELNDKLYELNSYSLQYYEKVNSSYHKTKEMILETIGKINESIEKCSNITFQTMVKKYEEIKNNFNSIDEINKKEEESELLINYKEKIDGTNYVVKTTINNLVTDNEIKIDIIFEDEEKKKPKIVGTTINKNRPKIWEIDVYSLSGQNGKYGRIITCEMNNVSFSVDLDFDMGSNNGSFNIKTDFDENVIKKYYYEMKESTQIKIIGGTQYPIPSYTKVFVEPPEGEEKEEIIAAKKNESKIPYDFCN